MRRAISIPLALALASGATASLAGAAWAGPADDAPDAGRATMTCDRDTPAGDRRTTCPGEAGVIDHLPDSFFSGGGGVGPQVVETGGGDHLWVHASGGSSAIAGATASAQASATVRVSVSGRARGRW